MNPIERRIVVFSGRVQGVGFRYTTQGIARRCDVTGYVRNLPDGRVELVAEGTRATLDAFVDEILLSMDQHIANHVSDSADAMGDFRSFEIRY